MVQWDQMKTCNHTSKSWRTKKYNNWNYRVRKRKMKKNDRGYYGWRNNNPTYKLYRRWNNKSKLIREDSCLIGILLRKSKNNCISYLNAGVIRRIHRVSGWLLTGKGLAWRKRSYRLRFNSYAYKTEG